MKIKWVSLIFIIFILSSCVGTHRSTHAENELIKILRVTVLAFFEIKKIENYSTEKFIEFNKSKTGNGRFTHKDSLGFVYEIEIPAIDSTPGNTGKISLEFFFEKNERKRLKSFVANIKVEDEDEMKYIFGELTSEISENLKSKPGGEYGDYFWVNKQNENTKISKSTFLKLNYNFRIITVNQVIEYDN